VYIWHPFFKLGYQRIYSNLKNRHTTTDMSKHLVEWDLKVHTLGEAHFGCKEDFSRIKWVSYHCYIVVHEVADGGDDIIRNAETSYGERGSWVSNTPASVSYVFAPSSRLHGFFSRTYAAEGNGVGQRARDASVMTVRNLAPRS